MRRLVALVVVSLAALTAGTVEAAPKSQPLYFANTEESDGPEATCDPVYSLVRAQQDGGECSGTYVAIDGSGIYADDTYTSERAMRAFRVDTRRRVTGEIWVQHIAIVNTNPRPTIPSLPGYVDLDVTIRFDGIKVGAVTISGPVPAAGGLRARVALRIPGRFAGRTVRKVTAAVEWRTALGLSGISYTEPNASFIRIPVR